MTPLDERLPPCPACAGEHLYGLTYRHDVGCRIYAADAATAANDHDLGAGIRPIRNHEKELIHHVYEEPTDGLDFAIRFSHRGVHCRAVVLVDAHGRYVDDAARGADDV